MKILGIETSCDETAVCIIEAEGKQIKILGNQLYSQIALHTQYGGVFPMMAKREHQANLTPLFEKVLEESNLLVYSSPYTVDSNKDSSQSTIDNLLSTILNREPELLEQLANLLKKIERPNIDAIAVTNGPGLEPALWVGVNFAKALSTIWNIPVIPTNHMEGHIVAAGLQQVDSDKYIVDSKNQNYQTIYSLRSTIYPSLALLVSGGHTQLVLIKDFQNYEVIGNTKDDAIGEAFDKVARILGLPYPGGPQISRLAEKERLEFPNKKTSYPLPRPMIHSGDLNFSFSGIKTAVLYMVKKIANLTDAIKQEIACEFENAVVEVIVKKTRQAIEENNIQTLIIGGGVSANKKIRQDFTKLAEELGVTIMIPELSASTDNALMIAVAGYLQISSTSRHSRTDGSPDFRAEGNLSL